MKISGIASGNTASKTTLSKPQDRFEKQIEALMNQKSQITDNIASIKSNGKLTEEQKKQRIETLSIQLQDIETQIMQLRMEQDESKKEKSFNNKATNPTDENSKASNKTTNETLVNLVSLDTHKDDLVQLHSIRRKLKADADRYRSEMKRDGSHTEGDPVVKYKTEKVIDLEGRASRLDLRIGDGYATTMKPNDSSSKAQEAETGKNPLPEKKQDDSDALDRREPESESAKFIDIRG